MPAPLTFRTIYDSPMVEVRDYVCLHDAPEKSPEEYSPTNSIVLMRHGAFSKHHGSQQVTADVNHAIFFSQGSTYRISHPAKCGDRGTTFYIPQPILTDIVRELDPSVDDRPETPFTFLTGPCPNEIFWRHRDFIRRLENGETEPLEPLWADVTALQLMADVLEVAFARFGSAPRRRASTAADHAERTEAAKSYLASRIGENVTLGEVADAVCSSPFNFARIFQEQTGLPPHQYLTQLRLRAALERLPEATDITALALDLGFSSHSHFTEVFRRAYGVTPSKFRSGG